MRIKIIVIVFIIFSTVSCERRYSGGKIPETKPKVYTADERLEETPKKPNVIRDTPQEIANDKTNPKVSDLFKKLEKSVFMVFATDDYGSGSQGSGFLLSNNIGITNFHVIDINANNYFILIEDKFYPIEDFYEYSRTDELDYIIFKIGGFSGKPLKISSERPEVGDDVFAIGSPKGLQNSLTKGTISGYRNNHRIQIDATIDHGSSGGPLFNMNGEVIGITSEGIEGSALNFAVDIQEIPFNKYY